MQTVHELRLHWGWCMVRTRWQGEWVTGIKKKNIQTSSRPFTSKAGEFKVQRQPKSSVIENHWRSWIIRVHFRTGMDRCGWSAMTNHWSTWGVFMYTCVRSCTEAHRLRLVYEYMNIRVDTISVAGAAAVIQCSITLSDQYLPSSIM